MITRDRLEELIQQKAKIYSTHWKEEVDLSLPCEIEYDGVGREFLLVQEDKDHRPSYWLQNLTEDVETAKWEEEFGCIERVECLTLPTWEEFESKKSKGIGFWAKDTNCFFELYEKDKKIIVFDHDCNYEYFNQKATKENYIKACRIAKRFFLGENNE